MWIIREQAGSRRQAAGSGSGGGGKRGAYPLLHTICAAALTISSLGTPCCGSAKSGGPSLRSMVMEMERWRSGLAVVLVPPVGIERRHGLERIQPSAALFCADLASMCILHSL